jgi:flavin reductase (DIM6/NTAB) family NADH-FMN oxidoreductase RutF
VIVFEPAEHDADASQSLLSALVAPRPIAMISTVDADGVTNVAPFSYYMPVTGKPMLLAVTMGAFRESDGTPKDTYANATRTGDFVVNVTTETFREHIETAAMEFPSGISELQAVPWTAVPSLRVSSPSIAESPAHLECEIREIVDLGDAGERRPAVHLVVAEVVCVVLDERFATPQYRVDQAQMRFIGRMGSPWFTEATAASMFALPRMSYDEYVTALTA